MFLCNFSLLDSRLNFTITNTRHANATISTLSRLLLDASVLYSLHQPTDQLTDTVWLLFPSFTSSAAMSLCVYDSSSFLILFYFPLWLAVCYVFILHLACGGGWWWQYLDQSQVVKAAWHPRTQHNWFILPSSGCQIFCFVHFISRSLRSLWQQISPNEK